MHVIMFFMQVLLVLSIVCSSSPVFSVEHGGIYQRMSYEDMETHLTDNIDHPLLAGIDFNLPWSLLEPKEGVYDFSFFNQYVKPWGEKGKRVVLNIVTLIPRGKAPSAGHATPQWLYQKGVKYVKVSGEKTPDGTAEYPLFWDKKYLEKYEEFVKALADKYDGNPYIDAIGIGIAKLGGLTVVDPKVAQGKKLTDFYMQNGYTPEKWFETIKDIIHIYKRHFRKTPVRITLSKAFLKEERVSEEDVRFIEKVADYAADNGVFLFHQSVSSKKDVAKAINEILGRNAGKVCTGAELVNPIYGTKEGNLRLMGSIDTAISNAVGGQQGIPSSSISYLNLYRKDTDASRLDPVWKKALENAHNLLKKCSYPGHSVEREKTSIGTAPEKLPPEPRGYPNVERPAVPPPTEGVRSAKDLKRILTQLNLSKMQKRQVKEILQQERQEGKQAGDRMAEEEKVISRIRAVLTEDQLREFDRLSMSPY